MTFLILGYTLLAIAHGQCSWSVTDPNDNMEKTLDLSCLSGHTFDSQDSEGHHYMYSVCQDSQSCNGETVMTKQTADANTCYILGRWDADKIPQWDSENEGGAGWRFTYDNGDIDCGNPARTWSPTYICDASTNYQVSTVDEIPNSCYYKVDIKTKYACVGTTYPCFEEGGSSGLGGGWIFVIVFVGAVFLYCVVGYIVMGTTVNKAGGLGDFSNNIPQKTLWVALPSLVIAGCCYTKDTIQGLFNKGGSSDMTEPIAETGGDE